ASDADSAARIAMVVFWRFMCVDSVFLLSTPQRQSDMSIAMSSSQRLYEVRPRKDHRGVDLISDVLPFSRLWYGEPNAVSHAIGYAIVSDCRGRRVGCELRNTSSAFI